MVVVGEKRFELLTVTPQHFMVHCVPLVWELNCVHFLRPDVCPYVAPRMRSFWQKRRRL